MNNIAIPTTPVVIDRDPDPMKTNCVIMFTKTGI